METEVAKWLPCSSCKGDIDFGEVYYVCDVATCNRGATDLRFCSVECWDVHVPVMRHRNAGAVEKRAPTESEWQRERAEDPAPAPQRPAAETSDADSSVSLSDDVPRDILVVVSKLKAYIRARSGMNTSDGVMTVLSDRLRALCDEGIHNAARDGRKTVMDRDFRPPR